MAVAFRGRVWNFVDFGWSLQRVFAKLSGGDAYISVIRFWGC